MICTSACCRRAGTLPAILGVLALSVALLTTPACADVPGETGRLVELLNLGPGSVVADVGAGDGKWTEALAEVVGPEGHVFSTEVESDLVDDLARRLERKNIENATAVLGSQSESGLPAACCDAVLLRMVYHHFQQPRVMRASLRRAIVPGGLVAIIDIQPQHNWRQLEGVPERGGHGIELNDLVDEMTDDGFELVTRHDNWNDDEDRYCAVFRRPTELPETPLSAESPAHRE